MKKIIELEKRLYKDIIFTIILVIISIPIWLNFGLSASAATAKEYDNYNYVKYEFLNQASTVLKTYKDDEALRLVETQDILVYNDSNTEDAYSLILKVSKDSKADLNKIRINVNYNVDYLNSYHVYDDATSYYFVIDSNSIVAQAQKYVISMWNIEDNNSDDLKYEFVVL